MKTKKCSQCGKEKPLTEFCKNKRTKDGLYYYCRECDKVRATNYYSKNKEIISEKSKNIYKNNTDKIKERNAIYRINHKEEYKEYNKEYHKQYKLNNADKLKSSRKQYKLTHKHKQVEFENREIFECRKHYIVKILSRKGFPLEKITNELIEAQRLIIKIKRLTNQKQN